MNKEGRLEQKFINYYKSAMQSREAADYHYSYSKDVAEYELEIATEFVEEIRKLI